LAAVLLREAMCIYEEGIATKEDIDKACKLAFNHPMGPLELADFSGLETCLYAWTAMKEVYGAQNNLVEKHLRDFMIIVSHNSDPGNSRHC